MFNAKDETESTIGFDKAKADHEAVAVPKQYSYVIELVNHRMKAQHTIPVGGIEGAAGGVGEGEGLGLGGGVRLLGGGALIVTGIGSCSDSDVCGGADFGGGTVSNGGGAGEDGGKIGSSGSGGLTAAVTLLLGMLMVELRAGL